MSDPIVLILLGLGGMFVLILLHVPIGVAMGIAGLVGFGLLSGFGPALSLLGTEPVGILSNADLAVIPLFLLMGSLAGVSGLSGDIYKLVYALVGHRRGGLAYATIAGCAGFGAVCGSSPATAAAMGKIALPEMLSRGYAARLASGSIAAGGTLGMIIPPSIVMVVYSFIAREFVITLFIAAIIPAIMAVTFYMLTILVLVRRDPAIAPAGPRRSWPERWRAAARGWGAVFLIGIIVFGLYGGILTVNEAAAVGVSVTLLFAVARRSLSWSIVAQIVRETATNTAMIYTIIFGASIFTYFVTATRLPLTLADTISALGLPPLAVILVLVLIYLVLGSIFETVSSMVITLPFILPLVKGMGYDPIWWGVVLTMVIELGMITPPIGMNVFVIHGIARDIPLGTVFRGITPFVVADLFRVGAVVLFPGLALWLPRILN
ncbi:MAG: TRAP transporter large permease [Rhodospirillaceae bacterium]|nr:TRAP transporter large permease [Rhodospirillaceae bacterium]